MVNDAQKKAIKDSWSGVDLQKMGSAFYSHMAKDAPHVFAVFNFGGDKGKEAAQALKVAQFIDKCVKNIDHAGAEIAPLADRHINYGAKKEHFPAVAGSLLAGLADSLGGKFTGEAKAAWAEFYNGTLAPGISAKLS